MQTISDVAQRLDRHRYPATTAELVDVYGDVEVKFPDGSETVAEVFDRLAEETYERSEEAVTAFYSAVSSDAIGRKFYSDRDPGSPGAESHPDRSL